MSKFQYILENGVVYLLRGLSQYSRSNAAATGMQMSAMCLGLGVSRRHSEVSQFERIKVRTKDTDSESSATRLSYTR